MSVACYSMLKFTFVFHKIVHTQSKTGTGNAGKKLRDIRDMLYFKPCNFTLSTLYRTLHCHSLNKNKNVDATIDFFNFACYNKKLETLFYKKN